MSPEQIKGYQLNQKTDLYSLGVVMFQLLTGRLPFRAKNQATLIYRIINTDAPDVTSLNPSLPEGLNAILRKALEKDLYSRYRNGAEFAKDLAAVRYQILEDDETVQDNRHFEMLRKLDFFTDFENVELWEILRISVWRQIAPRVAIIREGEVNRVFGIVIEGYVESLHRRPHAVPSGKGRGDRRGLPICTRPATSARPAWSRWRTRSFSKSTPPHWPWPPRNCRSACELRCLAG
jgi:serine/threonine protein kinase